MMKVFVMLLLAAAALMCLNFSSTTNSLFPNVIFNCKDNSKIMTATSRKLKEDGYMLNSDKDSNASSVILEDYRPIDPVPSSKASVRPGPIQHGTPLMPFIPKPSPPGHPKHGGFS